MTGTEIRPATSADLDQVCSVWYEAETEGFPDPPPRGDLPPIFQHELDSGEMYVAEIDGRVLAYTALITRGTTAYLAELYVRRELRQAGLGQALLRQILPRDGRTCSTSSSTDRRALALYIRAGMRPLWPHFLLKASSTPLSRLPTAARALPARPGDPDLVRWDAEIGGRHRPQDHAYWLDGAGAIPFWLARNGETIGYGYVQKRNHEALWYPNALSLGPVGARTAADALDCVCALVRWAAPQAPTLLLGVPAAHPCLPVLLKAGFYIDYVETFVTTAAEPFANPQHYVPSSSTLF